MHQPQQDLRLLLVAVLGALALPVCVEPGPGDDTEPEVAQRWHFDDGTLPHSTSVVLTGAAADQEELQGLLDAIDVALSTSLEELEAQNALPFENALPFDPAESMGLDLIQSSALALDETELAALAERGFVISERTRFPTFAYGYVGIYQQDLPVYISADSILHALYRSLDDLLAELEARVLRDELSSMLDELLDALVRGEAAPWGAQTESDLGLFLAVAKRLLTGHAPTLPGVDSDAVEDFYRAAEAAQGPQLMTLFGQERRIDFSQFTPRGHYTDSPDLEAYFRAMMWLGRVDFRLIETQSDHSQVFRRRQLDAMVALRALSKGAAEQYWSHLDAAIGAFIGESDSMRLDQVDALLADLGVSPPDELADLDDATIAQTIIDGGYGRQRISSHIMTSGLRQGTMPLSYSFLLFGQRFVIDSYVFSNLVWDRLQTQPHRMMPDPLDVAYAALANDQAVSLLADELAEFHYAGELEAMRVLVDAHAPEFWGNSLYNRWLVAIRALSPHQTELADPTAAGLPALVATEAFGRRVLSSQLASWAELRNQSILYAKQSYTTDDTCEFPAAYVEPYPEFFAAIAELALHGLQAIDALDLSTDYGLVREAEDYFVRLYEVSEILEEMARFQREGRPFTDTHMVFINQAVSLRHAFGCGGPPIDGIDGWYADLFFDHHRSIEFEPPIADVHTQSSDRFGNEVGRILHVGTGLPRLMVVAIDNCQGPQAYVGLVSSYFERITEGWDRLDDERWAEELLQETPPDVDWMRDIVVRD